MALVHYKFDALSKNGWCCNWKAAKGRLLEGDTHSHMPFSNVVMHCAQRIADLTMPWRQERQHSTSINIPAMPMFP